MPETVVRTNIISNINLGFNIPQLDPCTKQTQGNHVSERTLQQNYTRPEKIKVKTFSFVNIYEDTAYKDIVLLSMRIVVSPQTTSRKVKNVYEKREKS